MRKVACRFLGRGVDADDLIGEGQLGLLAACERFDPAKGFRFSTFAAGQIRHAIQRGIRETWNAVRVPAHVNESRSRVHRGKATARDRKGSLPELRLAAEALFARRFLRSSAVLASCPCRRADADEAASTAAELVATLPPTMRRVVESHFGLKGEPRSTREIGREIGGPNGQARAEAILGQALRYLREGLEFEMEISA